MSSSARFDRVFRGLLAHRLLAGVGLVLFTGVLVFYAARVRPDYTIELLFPTFDRSRLEYEELKKDFPFEDAHALVIVEASDLFTPAGLKRVAALEADLARIPGVVDTQGLSTVSDVTAEGDTIRMEKLFPPGDLSPAELARRRTIATTDPLFTYNLAPPDGRATTIRVTLTRAQASTDAARTAFTWRARAVIAEHAARARQAGAHQELTLNGLPVIRTEFTEMINKDFGRLLPLALAVILIILYLTTRTFKGVVAAFVTILFSVVWSAGAMGIVGVPIHVLSQLTPIIVMIISISDTVHILAHGYRELEGGAATDDAIAASCTASAFPCLLTEITIAGGFLSLLTNDMVMIQQFGVVTALGVLLAWLANVTVLPLTMSLLRLRAPRRRAPAAGGRGLSRLIGWIESVVVRRPRRIVLVAAALSVAALLVSLRAGKEYYSYDDLRPRSQLFQHLRTVERIHGGTVPMAIHVRPKDATRGRADAMLEPAALALIDRLTAKLSTAFPEDIKHADSFANYMRKAHRIFAGEAIARAAPLPGTRALAVQELAMIDDPAALRDILAFDRGAAAIYCMMPDKGSSRASKIIAELNAYFATEEAQTPYRITLTGIYGIADGIYRSLVGGLVGSFALALLVSFGIFCVVLWSWRLGLIALVPNVLPLLLTLGLMSLLGIDIKPSTVIIFSITLVIADDDTIQFLAHFRAHYVALRDAGAADAHREAALRTLRETGLPMITSTCAIAVGFFAMVASEFQGLANLGLLIGISLLTAVVADLFLSPLLIMYMKPRIGRASPQLERPRVIHERHG